MTHSDLIFVLEYAKGLLQECADNGYYPKSALSDNEGYGFAPITRAIADLKRKEPSKPPEIVGQDYALNKLKTVDSPLSDDYRNGYAEGVRDYVDDLRKSPLYLSELNVLR